MRVWLSVLLVALAGCGEPPMDAVDEGPEIVVSDRTGGIRGVVVDAAIQPLVDAVITLHTGETTRSDEAGFFGFGDLDPGTYFVGAEKPAYAPVQQSIEVVAGVATPPVMKIQMTHLGAKAPYQLTMQYSGYIVCSLGISLIFSEECGEGVGLPDGGRVGKNEQNHIRFDFQVDGPHAQTLIVEQIWEPGTEAARQLLTLLATGWACEPACGGNGLGNGKGESPLYLRVDHEAFADVVADPETVFTTYALADNDVDEVNVALEQSFEQFVTVFYNEAAAEGWSFLV